MRSFLSFLSEGSNKNCSFPFSGAQLSAQKSKRRSKVVIIVWKIVKFHALTENFDRRSTHYSKSSKCKSTLQCNGIYTYNFEIEREFGTDFGLCCVFVPQLNLTEIIKHQLQNNLEEPDWGYWFENLPKGAKTGQNNGYKIVFDIQAYDYSADLGQLLN